MVIKNKKGVTLTILVITIIVMFILFGITISTTTNLLKNSQRGKMKTMLYMIQGRAEILLDDYLFDYDNEIPETRANNLASVGNEVIVQKLAGTYVCDAITLRQVQNAGFESESIPNKNRIIYCIWNKDVLESQGIDTKNLAQGDSIIIQYNLLDNSNEIIGTVEVASTKGFSNKGVSIHKLSDF